MKSPQSTPAKISRGTLRDSQATQHQVAHTRRMKQQLRERAHSYALHFQLRDKSDPFTYARLYARTLAGIEPEYGTGHEAAA